MSAVWKFELPPKDTSIVLMPSGAKILSVGFQGEALCVWALVYPRNPKEPRAFSIRGTGHLTDGLNVLPFIGTVFHPLGLVFHVWDGDPSAQPSEPESQP